MGQERLIRAALDAVDPTETEALLEKLVAIESHGDTPELECRMAAYLAEWFAAEGIESRVEEVSQNRPNVIARLCGSGGGRSLVFNGHTDTVPPYGMMNAFTAVKREGRIYGRGSVDMKGALAAMMISMAALKRSGVQLAGDVIFAATVGEETYSPGAFHLVGSGFSADYAIVGEPTGLQVGVAHKGVAWFEAEFGGVSVHGSVPEQGINAIYRAARWIEHIQDEYIPMLQSRSHPLLGTPTINIGMIEGGTRPVIVPNRCVIRFERRLIPGETAESARDELLLTLEAIRRKHPGFEGDIRIMDNFLGVPHGPLQTPADGILTEALVAAHEADQGAVESRIGPVGLQFWTDGALLQAVCGETVVCGPGQIGQAHSDEEYIEAEQLHRACRMYVRTAIALCGRPSLESAPKGVQA